MSNKPNTAEEIVNLIMNGGATAKGKGRKNLQEWGVEMVKEYAKNQTLDRLKEELPDKIADMLGIYGSCESDVGNGCQKFDSGNCNCRTGFILKVESIIEEISDED